MIDPLQAFLALLLDDPDLVTETGGRIRGTPPGLEPADYNTDTGLPNKALVVQQAGGIVQHMRQVTAFFYLVAYGQEGYEAQSVLSKLYGILYDDTGEIRCNRVINDRWFMYWAKTEALSAPVTEQQSTWPVAYATVSAKFDALSGA
jgi:hypothetical protein